MNTKTNVIVGKCSEYFKKEITFDELTNWMLSFDFQPIQLTGGIYEDASGEKWPINNHIDDITPNSSSELMLAVLYTYITIDEYVAISDKLLARKSHHG